jgi:hypothetical protein
MWCRAAIIPDRGSSSHRGRDLRHSAANRDDADHSPQPAPTTGRKVICLRRRHRRPPPPCPSHRETMNRTAPGGSSVASSPRSCCSSGVSPRSCSLATTTRSLPTRSRSNRGRWTPPFQSQPKYPPYQRRLHAPSGRRPQSLRRPPPPRGERRPPDSPTVTTVARSAPTVTDAPAPTDRSEEAAGLIGSAIDECGGIGFVDTIVGSPTGDDSVYTVKARFVWDDSEPFTASYTVNVDSEVITPGDSESAYLICQ